MDNNDKKYFSYYKFSFMIIKEVVQKTLILKTNNFLLLRFSILLYFVNNNGFINIRNVCQAKGRSKV